METLLLGGVVVTAVLAWGHWALERNVNRMAQQLHDQIHAAAQRIDYLERKADESERQVRDLERQIADLERTVQ